MELIKDIIMTYRTEILISAYTFLVGVGIGAAVTELILSRKK